MALYYIILYILYIYIMGVARILVRGDIGQNFQWRRHNFGSRGDIKQKFTQQRLLKILKKFIYNLQNS